jgi:DNA helicase-2/ATP-dependent DNA helicase PcrA
MLSRNESMRPHYQYRFTDILIDEFQDTNRLQYRWIRLLAGPNTAVFGVGDDDQAIYAFRGANVGNMQSFERDFSPVKLIKLEQNYRSHGNILDAANALIRNNTRRLGKNLWTEAGHGEPLRVFAAPGDTEEAAFVVDAVKSAADEGVALSDIAVLYRSNAQSRVLEHTLFTAGMPYRVYGGMRFFERAEVKHALAYLRLVANPEDDGALLRVINFPSRGIGARSLESLQEVSRAQGMTLWAAACANRIGGKSGTSIVAFVQLIESLRARTAGLPLHERVEQMLDESGLLAHYKAERDGEERVENLEELVNAARAFEQESGQRENGEAGASDDPLTAFLAHAALEAGETQAAEGRDALQLMTVHSAKGLEFHTVFVTGLEEGLFPHENSMTEDGGVEEERRLMYVAITRARQRLYLTYAQSRMLHGQTRFGIASRYVTEIPPQLLQWLSHRPSRRDDRMSYAGELPATTRSALRPPREPALIVPDALAQSGFRVGQNVRHAKFGVGVIIDAKGRGPDAQLQVNFRDAGVKWLNLEYAKLSPA